MTSEQYSLSDLRDVVLPDAPGLWPPAPGAWIAIVILAAVILILCWKYLAARKRNAYRRAGLLLLDNVKTVHEISVLLKRVALAAFPREKVASLYGKEWVDFLNRSCPKCNLSETDLAVSSDGANSNIIKLADFWIRHHRGNLEP